METTIEERWRLKERECGFDDDPAELVPCGEAELPRDAAPCLTFDRAEQPVPVWNVFGTGSDWPVAERDRLAAYLVIGSDGAGNPVCIEQPTGNVWLLDHEDRFRSRQYVNSSVSQLAECLLAYMGEEDPERFRSAVQSNDSPALAEGSFWSHEAAGIGNDA